MRILFLHGWHSVPGGVKPTFLKHHGQTVVNPALDDDAFDAVVCTAQVEYDQHQPDVIVGSSRGGAAVRETGNTSLDRCEAIEVPNRPERNLPNNLLDFGQIFPEPSVYLDEASHRAMANSVNSSSGEAK
ncbi:MAG: hypothetical protein KF752_09600 [Pirellulaceae bacterium]|nr:hypothetical protein [Pirellulaceae bacterium]